MSGGGGLPLGCTDPCYQSSRRETQHKGDNFRLPLQLLGDHGIIPWSEVEDLEFGVSCVGRPLGLRVVRRSGGAGADTCVQDKATL